MYTHTYKIHTHTHRVKCRPAHYSRTAPPAMFIRPTVIIRAATPSVQLRNCNFEAMHKSFKKWPAISQPTKVVSSEQMTSTQSC